MGFRVTARRVTRKEIGSYWLGSVVRRCVLKMALPNSLYPDSPERSVGREGRDHAEGLQSSSRRKEGWTDLSLQLWGRGQTGPSVRAGLRRSQPLTDHSNQAPDKKVLG